MIKVRVFGVLDGLRAWAVGLLFAAGAWLAGYDVELNMGPRTWEEAKEEGFVPEAELAALAAVADAAQAVLDKRPWLEPTTEGERYLGAMVHIFVAQGWWEALKDALAALRVEKEGA